MLLLLRSKLRVLLGSKLLRVLGKLLVLNKLRILSKLLVLNKLLRVLLGSKLLRILSKLLVLLELSCLLELLLLSLEVVEVPVEVLGVELVGSWTVGVEVSSIEDWSPGSLSAVGKVLSLG